MLAASQPLGDARYALARLEMSEDSAEFRVFWVATVALLRAVGHVLAKVDAEDSNKTPAINSAWKRWQADRSKHSIFWHFVEAERNNVLKTYEFGYDSGPVQLLAAGEVFELGDNLFTPLPDGPFAGEDARDVARMAIAWWDAELRLIDPHHPLEP